MKSPSSFRGAPPVPREARPVGANPESRTTTSGFRVRGFASARDDVYVGARAIITPASRRRAAKGEHVQAGFWRDIPPAKRAPLPGRRSFLGLGAALTAGLALRQSH